MWLVSCGSDLKVHNSRNYEIINIYRPTDSSGHIQSISWCKDGSWLVLVPHRGNIEIVRTKDDVRLLQSILSIPCPTRAAFQRTTKKHIAISTSKGDVLVYDIKARAVKKYFSKSASDGIAHVLDWNFKDSHLVTGTTDGKINLYSNTTNQKISVLCLPKSKSVSVVKFHPLQRSYLGTSSDEGKVVVWDINNSTKKLSLEPHSAPVTDIVFSSLNKNLMISVGLDRTYQCYDINSNKVVHSVLVDHPLSSVDMALDGYTITTGSTRGALFVYDLRAYQKPFATVPAHSGEVKKVLYQPSTVDKTDSIINLTEEKPVEAMDTDSNKNTLGDSFDLNAFTKFTPKFNVSNNKKDDDSFDLKTKCSSTIGDSFLAKLDNIKDNKSDLSDMNVSEKKLLDNMQHNHQQQQQQHQFESQIPVVQINSSELRSSHERLSDILPTSMASNAPSSTPLQVVNQKLASVRCQDVTSPASISPIQGHGTSQFFATSSVPLDQLNTMLKDAVTEVLEEHMNDYFDQMNRQFLNLQLTLAKEFVNIETQIERVPETLFNFANASNESLQMQQLQQENAFLKAKINELLRKH